MKLNKLSFRKIIYLLLIGLIINSALVIYIGYKIANSVYTIYIGALLLFIFLIWGYILIDIFQKKLQNFTNSITNSMDFMINGNPIKYKNFEEDDLLSRINHRLERLYNILYENKRRTNEEKKNLEYLITDISHQVKIPTSNLKMINDTLLSKDLDREIIKNFLITSNSQIDKLDFLIQSMIKISRLETGIIELVKKPDFIYETIISALNGVLLGIEEKEIQFVFNGPEDLIIPHDIKWTGEALFNILDNAVKYTQPKGKIEISVENWERYVKIDIKDTGKGIAETEYAKIFHRFYREDEVHNEDGVGVGLYLAREIIMKQGGYIKVHSEIGIGSIFSVFLLNK